MNGRASKAIRRAVELMFEGQDEDTKKKAEKSFKKDYQKWDKQRKAYFLERTNCAWEEYKKRKKE